MSFTVSSKENHHEKKQKIHGCSFNTLFPFAFLFSLCLCEIHFNVLTCVTVIFVCELFCLKMYPWDHVLFKNTGAMVDGCVDHIFIDRVTNKHQQTTYIVLPLWCMTLALFGLVSCFQLDPPLNLLPPSFACNHLSLLSLTSDLNQWSENNSF